MTYEYMTGMGAGSIVDASSVDASSTVPRPTALAVRPVVQPAGMSKAEIYQYRAELKNKSEAQLQTLILLHQRSQATNAGWATGAAPGVAERYRDAAIRAGQMLRLEQQELQLRQLPVAAQVSPAPATLQPVATPPHPWGDAQIVDVARNECRAQGKELQRADVGEGMRNIGIMQACCTPSIQSQLLNGDFYCCPDIEATPSGVMTAVMRAMDNALRAANPSLPSAVPADQAAAQFYDVVRQSCQQSPCDAEIVKFMLTHPLYIRSPVVQQALPICNQALAQQQSLTQRAAPPWYKQPAVLIAGGVIAAVALMKLMGQRGGMQRNPAGDYKVGDLVVNHMMAIGRVLAVHDDYVNVRVKSGRTWATSNWPYEILMEPAKAASYIAFKKEEAQEVLAQPNPNAPFRISGSADSTPGKFRVYAESDFGEEMIGNITGSHVPPAGFYIHWVRGTYGPDVKYNKGPHPSKEAAAKEVYKTWNEIGRIWIGE